MGESLLAKQTGNWWPFEICSNPSFQKLRQASTSQGRTRPLFNSPWSFVSVLDAKEGTCILYFSHLVNKKITVLLVRWIVLAAACFTSGELIYRGIILPALVRFVWDALYISKCFPFPQWSLWCGVWAFSLLLFCRGVFWFLLLEEAALRLDPNSPAATLALGKHCPEGKIGYSKEIWPTCSCLSCKPLACWGKCNRGECFSYPATSLFGRIQLLMFLSAEGDSLHYLPLPSSHLFQFALINLASFLPHHQLPVPESIPLPSANGCPGLETAWFEARSGLPCPAQPPGRTHIMRDLKNLPLTPIFTACWNSSWRFLSQTFIVQPCKLMPLENQGQKLPSPFHLKSTTIIGSRQRGAECPVEEKMETLPLSLPCPLTVLEATWNLR